MIGSSKHKNNNTLRKNPTIMIILTRFSHLNNYIFFIRGPPESVDFFD